MKATNEAGVTVVADESVIRRLGPGWVIDSGEKPEAKAPAKKAAPRKRAAKKSE